jgi:hypothetical protein
MDKEEMAWIKAFRRIAERKPKSLRVLGFAPCVSALEIVEDTPELRQWFDVTTQDARPRGEIVLMSVDLIG